MKDTANQEPVILKLLHAAYLQGSRTVWPSIPHLHRITILLIITKSMSPFLQPNKAYFQIMNTSSWEQKDWNLEGVEGFLFLVERQEAGGMYEEISLPTLAPYLRLCEHIIPCANSGESLERFRGHVYFQELLYELYRARDYQWKHTASTAVEQTKAYIDTHYAQEMTIDGLAAMAGISSSYYMELFKKNIGKSPIDYLTSVRIEAAKKLLDHTGASTHQVAESVGYKDPFYFSRQFKRVIGIPPSRYARRSTHRIASFHYPMTGLMLALQNIPYAAPLDREFCLFYKQKYELDIPIHLRDPSVGTNIAFNLHALQQSRPDVIIAGDWLSEADQGELSRIAPTLYVPWWEKDWREHLLIVARYLEETMQAERWLDKYDAQAAKVRGWLRSRLGDSSVMAIHVLQGKMYLFGNRNLGGVLYGDLGLRSSGSNPVTKAYEPISFEQLLSLNPDRLLAAVANDPLSLELWASLTLTLEWKELNAVQRRHVYRIEPDPWFDYSAMGHERILKEVVKLFSSDRPC